MGYSREPTLTITLLLLHFLTFNPASTEIDDSHNQLNEGKSFILKLPKLFEFEHFKQLFHKSYSNKLEESVRKSVYLARALLVFLSRVAFKHAKQTYYLSINHMTDWTASEIRSMYINSRFPIEEATTVPTHPYSHQASVFVPGNDDVDFLHAKASEAEVKHILDNLLEQNEKPSLASSLKQELESASGQEVQRKLKKREKRQSNPTSESEEKSNIKNTAEQQDSSSYLGKLVQGVKGAWSGIFSFSNPEQAQLPDEVLIDWRQAAPECYQSVRDQGQCASCYIFASIALYEWHFCRSTHRRLSFSEQFVIDCGEAVGTGGCNGGIFLKVWDFVDEFGLELRDIYPYLGRVGQCSYYWSTPPPPVSMGESEARSNNNIEQERKRSSGSIRVKTAGFEVVPYENLESQLKREPMLMNIFISDDFISYGGGVHSGKGCNKELGHTVMLVGSGRQNGQEYWLMRNSHGHLWGEEGHYRLSKKATNCISPLKGAKLNPVQLVSI